MVLIAAILHGARFLLRILKHAGSRRREAKHGNEVRSWPCVYEKNLGRAENNSGFC
jgi:hypothetical protein